MAAGSNSIVEDWLRSVDLVQYTQSFLDNGYDDLEVCKQIGEDDLDAIGVPRDEHREKLLRAVRVLREEGGTAVYFTLEECDTCQSGDETEVGEVLHEEDLLCLPPSCGNGSRRLKGGGAVRLDAYDMGKTTLVTYPKVQLKLILRDKLVEDNIDLAGPPFTTSDLSVCGSSLTALAIRFAEELKTHFIDVLERLEELWIVARNNENFCSQTLCRSPARGVYGGTQSLHYGYHPQYYQHIYPYPGSPRNQPPPLPSCPPPPTMSSTYLDRCNSLQSHLDGGHIRVDPTAHQNYVALDGGVCCLFSRKIIREPGAGSHEDKKKSGSVFGRFLRNIGFRRSNRKGTYKQHQGDLNAYEISMSDEDRMALMILVKEGKISTQTALAVVQKFEEERRAVTRTVSEEGKENVCHDTPSKKGLSKKKKAGKPTKSQSTLSADDPQRCDACPSKSPADEHMSCDHQICRQRRVHSLGQLDVPHLRPQIEPQLEHHMERVPLTRAVSCSPACPQNQKMIYPVDQASLVSRLHSPGHQLPQQAQTNHHHHHHHQNLNKVDALRERLTGKTINVVPKTSSKTSLLSSGSDQSMETGTQTPLRTDPMSRRGTDSVTYNSNSTVSMSSDNNSPGLSRKKSGPMLDPRVKSHRSASCSTGDDGISSENDDNDSNSKRQETGKVKNSMNNKKLTRIRDGGVSRPPLLRQLSAPVGAANLPGPYLGQAKVIVDYTPTAEEEDFVHLKKGEVVNIINMAQSGVWLGVVNGKRGKFRFEHVEVVAEPDKTSASSLLLSGQKDIPKSVEDLLQRIGLGHLANAFLLNGYDDLDIFSELDGHDLDTLHITDQDQRTKLLSAARVLVDWHEQFGAQTPTLTNMDSPSSRAGNSSCDSGCYASGEGTKHHSRRRNEGGHKKAEDGAQVHKPHTPCRSCGKPKQPRKYSNPVNSAAHYMPGQYPSIHSPYSPGHFQYAGHQQQLGPYTPGYYGYHTSGHHGHRHVMSGSRTLTELNAADTQNVPVKLETFASGKQISVRASPVQSAVGMMPVSYSDKKPTVGDRVSLTEEDKEVISITCGNNQTRKLSTPIQTLTSGSSQLEINNSSQCSGCVPMTGCPQCDESYICESASCVQCVTYASCPQCFPYRHYVNTTMRSDSKSSKMSCSSTCTQTTCLSPDHDDSSHSGGSNLIDYSSISSPLGYPMSKASPNRAQPFYYYQQQYTQPAFGHAIVHLTGRATTPSQLPSPAPVPKGLPTAPPLTLALAESSLAQGVALTLQADAQPLPLAQPDWSKQPDNAEEAPGMATLYSRGRSQTPEKSEKSGGQLKSPTRSLMPLVSTKLSAEIIDLTQSPYSSAIGHCGIPPLLVQRYSEELRQDMETMSLVIEQLRETQLRAQGRPCIQNESLSESCKLACDLQISSVQNFLISIGLPMYFKPLTDNGVTTLDQMLKLKDGELEKITGADSRHLKRISHALEWVQHKLGSPNHKPHATGVTDKV